MSTIEVEAWFESLSAETQAAWLNAGSHVPEELLETLPPSHRATDSLDWVGEFHSAWMEADDGDLTSYHPVRELRDFLRARRSQ